MIIDFTAHIITRPALEIVGTLEFAKQFPPTKWFPPEQADPDERLKIMKKYNIDLQVLSLSSPILTEAKPEEATKVCKISNDRMAEICEKYPGKFEALAAVSLLDIGSALDELDRAVSELGLKGVMTGTNHNGKPIDSPEYAPFLEKMVKYDMPLFLHPMPWKSYELAEEYRLMHVFGWPFDTAIAVARLIFGGTLDKYPTLKIVTHHLGALLPYLAGRMNSTYNIHFKERLAKPLQEYYKMIYGDTALDGWAPALTCGYAFFGPDRIVFGTDYPFGTEKGETFVRDNLAGVLGLKIPEEDRIKILEGNAKKLLKLT